MATTDKCTIQMTVSTERQKRVSNASDFISSLLVLQLRDSFLKSEVFLTPSQQLISETGVEEMGAVEAGIDQRDLVHDTYSGLLI